MDAFQKRMAVYRLKNAPMKSRLTEKALHTVRRCACEETLVEALQARRQGPVALEALCALRSSSGPVYQAVLEAIDDDLALSWSLIESLNRLPWYDGMRAFLSLPHPPATYPSAYAFYILARNKVFFPTDMSSCTYDYHFDGLWAMLPTARSGNWRQAHPSAFAVVELLHNRLSSADPDMFVVYFAALMLGGIRPLRTSIARLKARTQQHCSTRLRQTAALALALLEGEDNGPKAVRARLSA